jgi:DNA-binding transcriptional regulator GbsR (MarR family)
MGEKSWRTTVEDLVNSSRILYLLYSSGGLTFGELFEETQLSKPTVSRHLKWLIGLGFVIQEGLGGNRKYVVESKTARLIGSVSPDRYVATLYLTIVEKLPKKKRKREAVRKFLEQMRDKEKLIHTKRADVVTATKSDIIDTSEIIDTS